LSSGRISILPLSTRWSLKGDEWLGVVLNNGMSIEFSPIWKREYPHDSTRITTFLSSGGISILQLSTRRSLKGGEWLGVVLDDGINVVFSPIWRREYPHDSGSTANLKKKKKRCSTIWIYIQSNRRTVKRLIELKEYHCIIPPTREQNLYDNSG